jgi:predicted RND superfamily exporter protein
MNWRTKTEAKIEVFSDWLFENAKKTILVIFLLVAALGSQLPSLKIDTTTEGFLHKTDPMRVEYDIFRDQFGRDEKLMIAVKTGNIFDLNFLKKLDSFHDALESELPNIKGVDSLINARNTYGIEGELIVEPLIDSPPETEEALFKLKEIVTSNSLYENSLYSEDFTMTTVTIDTETYSNKGLSNEPDSLEFDDGLEFDDDSLGGQRVYLTDAENDEIIAKTQLIMQRFDGEDFKIYLSGSAAIAGIFKQALMNDSVVFISLMMVVIMVVLFALFRRISGVILPLACVSLTLITTVSLMSVFSAPFTMATQIMPTFLLAVVTSASIHLLAVFYKDFATTNDKKTSLRYAMGHSGLAIIMTSITTAVGLWSFSFSGVAPVADLGIFASSGVMIGLVFTLVFLPALISITKVSALSTSTDKDGQTLMDRVLIGISVFATGRPKLIVSVSTVLIICAAIVAAQLRFSHFPLQWLPEDNFARIATEAVDENLKGSLTLEVVIDTGETNGLYNPELLRVIDDVSQNINSISTGNMFVGKVISYIDVIKETNRALNENREEYYAIPDDPDLIAQEFLLFESSGNDDLSSLVDANYSKARLTLKTPFIDSLEANIFIDSAQVYLDQKFGPLAKVTFTGIGTLMTVTFEEAIYSSAFSYVLAFSLITILMVLLIGNLKIGLISMIPNILPIIFLSTIMVIFKMPLDMFTLLIGAIALGLAVDDTVHFMHNFRRYELKYNDVDKAVRLTLLGTGRAITLTSIVLALGFLVLTFSQMNNMFDFGVLTASAILVAVLADFFLMPAIMKLIIKDKTSM